MGYHLKLNSIDKIKFEEFDFSQGYDEVYDDFRKKFKYEFELGDFLDFSKLTKIKSRLGDVYKITEADILSFIEQYAKNELNYYTGILKEENKEYQKARMIQYFQTKIFNLQSWKYNLCLDKDVDRLTNNWNFEFDMIDLVRIYKTFDFDNNILIVVGS